MIKNTLVVAFSLIACYSYGSDLRDKIKIEESLPDEIVKLIKAKEIELNKSFCFALDLEESPKAERLLSEFKEELNLSEGICENGNTALHLASMRGHTGIVGELLNIRGVDVNRYNFHYNTPLHFAAKNGHTNIVKMLLEKGADADLYNEQSEKPLWMAINETNNNENGVVLIGMLLENMHDKYRTSAAYIKAMNYNYEKILKKIEEFEELLLKQKESTN